MIGGRVDVNLGAFAIVEIFAPIDDSAWDGRDVQGARAAANFVGHAKVIAARSSRDNRTGDRGDKAQPVSREIIFPVLVAGVLENGECVKTIAHEPRSEARARGEVSPPGGTKAGNRLPSLVTGSSPSMRGSFPTNQIVAAARVEHIAIPGEHTDSANGKSFAKSDDGSRRGRERAFRHVRCSRFPSRFQRLDSQS